jgi:hypothetical protein
MFQPLVEMQRSMLGEWVRGADQAINLVLQLQRTGLEVLDTWLSMAEQTQRSLTSEAEAARVVNQGAAEARADKPAKAQQPSG